MIEDTDWTIAMNNSSCDPCLLGPPPDTILRLPPPPFPGFLETTSDSKMGSLPFVTHRNDSPCKYLCDWRAEGVQYIEMPQQGTIIDDTWLLVLISSCAGVLFVGILLATLLLKCKFNLGAKSGVMSMPSATSTIQTKNGGLQNEAVLYPCTADAMQDSRVMWATLTPRGTTRHYLEEHTYETIGNGQFQKHNTAATAVEHTYVDPPALSPVRSRPRDDKSFDNTAFVDYEEPLMVKSDNEYYQLNDVLESNEQGLMGLQRGTLRPVVSSPTRIEHPNLPPLNLHPHKRTSRKNSMNHSSDTLLRSSITSSTYIPPI